MNEDHTLIRATLVPAIVAFLFCHTENGPHVVIKGRSEWWWSEQCPTTRIWGNMV